MLDLREILPLLGKLACAVLPNACPDLTIDSRESCPVLDLRVLNMTAPKEVSDE
jgi:hypothetical protein